jgi:AraC family transcriptional regulator
MLSPRSSTVSEAESRPTPLAIASLIENAAASFELDRNASREYLFRAFALLRAQVRPVRGEGATRTGGRLATWQTKRLVDYIEANLGSEIHAMDLARLVNLSTSHFFRAFKVSTGLSPFEYITQRRIQRATDMMRTTDEPLAHIAVGCGLSDQAHFCRVFRRLAGQSPNEWRRENAIRPRLTQAGGSGTAIRENNLRQHTLTHSMAHSRRIDGNCGIQSMQTDAKVTRGR